jgi:zinc transporter
VPEAKNRKTKINVSAETLAYAFDGCSGAQVISLERSLLDTKGGKAAFTWTHLNRAAPETSQWLIDSGLDGFVIDALTAEETRPRCTVHGAGVLLNLRGVNLDSDETSQELVSIRFWIEEKRIISVFIRPSIAIHDLCHAIERNEAPNTVGDLVAKVALRLADRAEPIVAALNEKIDGLEETLLDEKSTVPRSQLAPIRQTAIALRRYLVPQKDALTTLEIEDLKWLGDRDRSHIREAAERTTRLGEELDAIRDRAQVIHDEILDRRAEAMNRQMLILSVVAALFLPLGLLTGLLGVNVGGIPGADNPWAFEILCVVLVVIGAVQIWLFKRIGLF